jgi:hypothetical protein
MLTAEAGASLVELMNRMGHSSTRAAKVYLHVREARDRQLADVLDRMARRELKTVRHGPECQPIGRSGHAAVTAARDGVQAIMANMPLNW